MSVPGVTTAIVEAASAATMDSYVKSFHYGWDTALPFVAVALAIVFALDGPKIKTQMTWLIERPVSSTILRIRWAIADFHPRLPRSTPSVMTRSTAMENARERRRRIRLGGSRPSLNREKRESARTIRKSRLSRVL
jgi:hypothetical protein